VGHEGEVLEAAVTVKGDNAATPRLLKRVMKKNGRPSIIVTDRLLPIPRRRVKTESRIGTRSVAVSTIGPRILINRFDDEGERCSGSEV
jgi:transposase-like protein